MSFAGFYLLFQRVFNQQLDQRFRETSAPIIADLMADPEEKDVDQLDIHDQYFEVLDESGQVEQHSKNIATAFSFTPDAPGFQTIGLQDHGTIRVGGIAFSAANSRLQFVVGASTSETDLALDILRNRFLFCFRSLF